MLNKNKTLLQYVKVVCIFMLGNWLPLLCQKKNCPKMGFGPAERVCLNHELSMKHAENCPPPFYLCTDCADDLLNKKPNYQFHIVLQPLLSATWKCEYKVRIYNELVLSDDTCAHLLIF